MTYEEAKEQVAKKHNLGKTLVIGHRPAYYEEAAMLFTKFHVEAALKTAHDKAKREIACDSESTKFFNLSVKPAILNAYHPEKIK